MTNVINKEVCRCCGQTINTRNIVVFKGMILALLQVYNWCKKNNRSKDIKRSEFKYLFQNENSTGRFGDWRLFLPQFISGEKGRYNFDLNGLERFFNNEIEIPTLIKKSGKSDDLEKLNYKTIRAIPKLTEFLDSNNDFVVYYSNNRFDKNGQGNLF